NPAWFVSMPNNLNPCRSPRASTTGPRSWIFGMLVWGCIALAEEVSFDIPRQSAATALTEFAQQASVQVLFPYDRVGALLSNALVGQYQIDDGLKVLLEGTGLVGEFDDRGRLAIRTSERGVGST